MAPTLIEMVEQYYEFRGLVNPDATQALLFLVSEVGELADTHVHQEDSWVRNNQKERCITEEIGDVMMMLTVYAATQGTDPVACMVDKMRCKGMVVTLE